MGHDDGEEHQHNRRHVVRGLGLFLLLVGAVILWGPTIYANLSTRQYRYELSRVSTHAFPDRSVGIVLGAGLRDNGTKTSEYLQRRVETAVKLYKAGKVQKLLMTGDGSFPTHDEPAVMQRAAVALGVPKADILLDKFGFDTYDSCSRARNLRGITSAIVVTQGYHLPRAVLSCRTVGISAVGVNAQMPPGKGFKPFDIVREWLSTDKLFVQLAQRELQSKV